MKPAIEYFTDKTLGKLSPETLSDIDNALRLISALAQDYGDYAVKQVRAEIDAGVEMKDKEAVPKRFYYEVDNNSICIIPCKIKANGIAIGGVGCRMCHYRIESNTNERWIICSAQPEGRPKPE